MRARLRPEQIIPQKAPPSRQLLPSSHKSATQAIWRHARAESRRAVSRRAVSRRAVRGAHAVAKDMRHRAPATAPAPASAIAASSPCRSRRRTPCSPPAEAPARARRTR
eukprot:6175470-Pleurochrysis_carterae.AAC.1